MQMKDRTKLMFAEELEKLLETKPFDKVRVLDLCKRCGATPQTFYYHFKDKYDLAAWVFLHDYAVIMGDNEPEYSAERIAEMTKQMDTKRSFYQKAFTDYSQNAVSKYIVDFNVRNCCQIIFATTGQEVTGQQLTEIKYHNYGTLGLFIEWINDELSISIEEWAMLQYDRTPEFLREAFRKYRYSSEDILNTEK